MQGCTRHTCVRVDSRACAADRRRPGVRAARACQTKTAAKVGEAAGLERERATETFPGERSGSTWCSKTAAKVGQAAGPTDNTRGSPSVGETFADG